MLSITKFLKKNKILSVLTCTLQSRIKKFSELNNHLKAQAKKYSQIELLASIDNGEKTIGEKRNELLNAASGEYVVFVDDDDMVSDDYVYQILKAIQHKKTDCYGIIGFILNKDKSKKKFIHSLKYKEWFEDENAYYRCPNHLNPIRREHALAVGFKNISQGEDHDFSKRIQPLLKTEIFIPKPLYFYRPSYIIIQ
jgi:glycosyltransferase involved in cell wall biosynthesis